MAHTHHHHHVSAQQVAALPAKTAKLMRLAGYASIGVAVTLVAAKLTAWWLSESLSMLSSLTDSLFDVLVSVLNMAALTYALKPADDDHRFGHTAIEDIAGLAQFIFITASMLIIVLQSFERAFNPVPLHHETFGMSVSFFSMGLTLILVIFQGYVAKHTGSLIVAADRMHYLGDVLFNLGVIFALFLSLNFDFFLADPIIAIIIAICVIYGTFPIGRRAFDNLMGKEMPDEEKAKITQTVLAISGVEGFHKLRTRYMGMKPIIQLHVEMQDDLSFAKSHKITDQVESALMAIWPEAEIIVHGDPKSSAPRTA